MPKTIADERIKLTALLVAPVSTSAIKVTELVVAGNIELSNKILMSDFKLGPSGSESVQEPALSEAGNSSIPGKTNYEGSLTVFRFLDAAGKAVTAEDTAFNLMKAKGSELFLVKRIGPKWDAVWAIGQEYEYYHCLTDLPQDPSEFAGYIKKTIPLFVQGDSLMFGTTVA